MTNITNTFQDGIISDFHPLIAPNSSLTDALNATLVTNNGQEYMLQNDMGNSKIEDSLTGNVMGLRGGFIPLGMKEHGGILYIASYNQETGEGEIGTIPSPNITFTENTETYTSNKTFVNRATVEETEYGSKEYKIPDDLNKYKTINERVHNGYQKLFNHKLKCGDRFIIQLDIKDLQSNSVFPSTTRTIKTLDGETTIEYPILTTFNTCSADKKQVLAKNKPSYGWYRINLYSLLDDGQIYKFDSITTKAQKYYTLDDSIPKYSEYWFLTSDITDIDITRCKSDTSVFHVYPNIPSGTLAIRIEPEMPDSFDSLPNSSFSDNDSDADDNYPFLYRIPNSGNDLFYVCFAGFKYKSKGPIQVDAIRLTATNQFGEEKKVFTRKGGYSDIPENNLYTSNIIFRTNTVIAGYRGLDYNDVSKTYKIFPFSLLNANATQCVHNGFFDFIIDSDYEGDTHILSYTSKSEFIQNPDKYISNLNLAEHDGIIFIKLDSLTEILDIKIELFCNTPDRNNSEYIIEMPTSEDSLVKISEITMRYTPIGKSSIAEAVSIPSAKSHYYDPKSIELDQEFDFQPKKNSGIFFDSSRQLLLDYDQESHKFLPREYDGHICTFDYQNEEDLMEMQLKVYPAWAMSAFTKNAESEKGDEERIYYASPDGNNVFITSKNCDVIRQYLDYGPKAVSTIWLDGKPSGENIYTGDTEKDRDNDPRWLIPLCTENQTYYFKGKNNNAKSSWKSNLGHPYSDLCCAIQYELMRYNKLDPETASKVSPRDKVKYVNRYGYTAQDLIDNKIYATRLKWLSGNQWQLRNADNDRFFSGEYWQDGIAVSQFEEYKTATDKMGSRYLEHADNFFMPDGPIGCNTLKNYYSGDLTHQWGCQSKLGVGEDSRAAGFTPKRLYARTSINRLFCMYPGNVKSKYTAQSDYRPGGYTLTGSLIINNSARVYDQLLIPVMYHNLLLEAPASVGGITSFNNDAIKDINYTSDISIELVPYDGKKIDYLYIDGLSLGGLNTSTANYKEAGLSNKVCAFSSLDANTYNSTVTVTTTSTMYGKRSEDSVNTEVTSTSTFPGLLEGEFKEQCDNSMFSDQGQQLVIFDGITAEDEQKLGIKGTIKVIMENGKKPNSANADKKDFGSTIYVNNSAIMWDYAWSNLTRNNESDFRYIPYIAFKGSDEDSTYFGFFHDNGKYVLTETNLELDSVNYNNEIITCPKNYLKTTNGQSNYGGNLVNLYNLNPNILTQFEETSFVDSEQLVPIEAVANKVLEVELEEGLYVVNVNISSILGSTSKTTPSLKKDGFSDILPELPIKPLTKSSYTSIKDLDLSKLKIEQLQEINNPGNLKKFFKVNNVVIETNYWNPGVFYINKAGTYKFSFNVGENLRTITKGLLAKNVGIFKVSIDTSTVVGCILNQKLSEKSFINDVTSITDSITNYIVMPACICAMEYDQVCYDKNYRSQYLAPHPFFLNTGFYDVAAKENDKSIVKIYEKENVPSELYRNTFINSVLNTTPSLKNLPVHSLEFD